MNRGTADHPRPGRGPDQGRALTGSASQLVPPRAASRAAVARRWPGPSLRLQCSMHAASEEQGPRRRGGRGVMVTRSRPAVAGRDRVVAWA